MGRDRMLFRLPLSMSDLVRVTRLGMLFRGIEGSHVYRDSEFEGRDWIAMY